MAKKAKGKKGKAKKNTADQEKELEIQKLWDFLQNQCEQYEAHLDNVCKDACAKIRKIYDDKVKALPGNIRNMTLSEYLEMQNKNEPEPTTVDDIRNHFTKSKLMSEKKTQKKNKTERKRSLSASVCSSGKGVSTSVLSRGSKLLSTSDTSLNTPLSKRSAVPSYVITPKFNPRMPVIKSCMRKPRAGEIVLSMSGSPLQNFVDDVAVSLGGGKIIKITDDKDIARIENDFAKKLDADTKSTLENVKKQLDKILQA